MWRMIVRQVFELKVRRMGIFNIFRWGKTAALTVKAIRGQRVLGRELAALPMVDFVPRCLENLNQSGGAWYGVARASNLEAAVIASAKNLPLDLVEFYLACDGFESSDDQFPAKIFAIGALKHGAAYNPPLSVRVLSYWDVNGNDSERQLLMSVFPADDLIALAANSAQCFLEPSELDSTIPICQRADDSFVVVILNDLGGMLVRGAVLDIEAGSATVYPNFKIWLGSYAALFGSIATLAG